MRTSVFTTAIVGICLSAASSALDLKASHTPYKKPPQGCDCYTVSGPDPGYFQHYKLWDFRTVDLKKHAHLNLSDPIVDGDGEWDEWDDFEESIDESDINLPPETSDINQSDPTSLVFFKTSFERDWSSQAWERKGTPNAPVLMINSKNNIFLTRDYERDEPHATYLVLRTTRHDGYTSTAEIETRLRNIYRCSLRVRLRFLPADFVMAQPPQPREWPPLAPERHANTRLNNPTVGGDYRMPIHEDLPPSGACAGIFTYHDRITESDIEILTRDPSHIVHYANQPDYDFETDREIPGASTIAEIPVPWTTWATHRLDWFPDISRWLVNDQIIDARTYRVPNLQSMIVLNLWSDGGLWTGDMRLGDSIYMGIEYIELIYNRSSDVADVLRAPPQNPLHNDINIDPGQSSASDPGHFICKPGKEGRECRKHKFLTRPRAESCHKSCNIDEF
ncbi:Endo-1-3(4)-beta-glucanase [Penicillium brevicompactum]|uniref:Endo-1-3(4)-beta-glucanase n=1 Tax=Penicillium brevicompactum TaxID=5074 RepID=A0A9W9Q7K3_PENBR|nr:Endo-1-3(4)-beta-glucanase [Penicillium brevicompactum]